MSQQFSQGYALLIGVGRTQYPRWSLPVTVEDARALHSVLTDPNRGAYPHDDAHVRLLHDDKATRGEIIKGLDWLADAAAADKDATAVVFFSGHGWTDDSDGYFLIPHDVDPLDIASSALDGHSFTERLRQIDARRLLVVLDCCHAGGMASAKGDPPAPKLPTGFLPAAAPKGLVGELKQGAGRAVFSSSTGKQPSWTRPDGTLSLYTAHMIEALMGAASSSDDTVVRLMAVANYLSRAVAASAHAIGQEQTPFFDATTEDFPIALLLGGKGLNQAASNPVNTSTGMTTIHGDYVAGDKIQGDKIRGDKVVTNNHASNQGAQGVFHGPVTFHMGGNTQSTTPSVNPSDARRMQIDALRQQLTLARSNMYHLQMQSAQYGGEMATPLNIINGISNTRAEIRQAKVGLRNLGEIVEDFPSDEKV